MNELMPLLPEIMMTILALGILIAGAFLKNKDIIPLLTIAAVTAIAFLLPGYRGTAFDGMFISDGYSIFFKIIFMLNVFFTGLISANYIQIKKANYGEYYCLILLASTGMMLMASAGDLIVLYAGLELMSLSTYVLAGFLRNDIRSNEAALKYFLLGTFASAILLYGTTIIYGLAGTTNLQAVSGYLTKTGLLSNPALTVAVVLIVVSFSFKIAAAPFHMWAPDVYEGAPTSVTAFMSVGPKAAAFAAFGRVLYEGLAAAVIDWAALLIVISIITMALGNILALAQKNIKRMLAYSSIAHAGYMLLGVIPGTQEGLNAVMSYLLIYTFMNMGAFAIIIFLEKTEESGNRKDTELEDFAGFSVNHPILALSMLIFMFSLTGIPPTAGFIAKMNIFMAAVQAGYIWLVVIAVIFSIISAYYYLRLVVNMFMKKAPEMQVMLVPHASISLAVMISALAVCVIGIFPSLLIN